MSLGKIIDKTSTKLQQATYKGEEFETYQKIMLKLKGVIDKG